MTTATIETRELTADVCFGTPGMVGWYWSETDFDLDDCVWRDLGNGPQIADDGIWGPFATEAEAIAHAREMGR